MVMTGAQISVEENRFVLKTYSSPLDITDINNPILNREIENCSKPHFTSNNYFGIREPSSSEGHNVEYLEMVEIAPPIPTPLRGASFYRRGNKVSIRLRTDIPLYRLASLKLSL